MISRTPAAPPRAYASNSPIIPGPRSRNELEQRSLQRFDVGAGRSAAPAERPDVAPCSGGARNDQAAGPEPVLAIHPFGRSRVHRRTERTHPGWGRGQDCGCGQPGGPEVPGLARAGPRSLRGFGVRSGPYRSPLGRRRPPGRPSRQSSRAHGGGGQHSVHPNRPLSDPRWRWQRGQRGLRRSGAWPQGVVRSCSQPAPH